MRAVTNSARGLVRAGRSTLRSARRALRHARLDRIPALAFWDRSYGRFWNESYARQLVEREGELTGARSIYFNQPFRVEEYGILDALIRKLLEDRDRVELADVACGSGLAAFFVAMNRERYGERVRYVGVDSSDSQLFMARVRNPWSSTSFCSGNLYRTGLPDRSFDLVLNWQCMNHVGRIDEGLAELHRISRGVVYVIAYAFFDHTEFARRYGVGHEAEWADLAWAFDRDHVQGTIERLGARQLWRASEDASFRSSLPAGASAEHILLLRDEIPIMDWTDLKLDPSWRERLQRL
jgi:SAM-dependent methyltransferase